MAKKQKREEPKPAELTPDKIRMGTKKLKRRIKELQEFDIVTIQERYDPRVVALTAKINDTIAEIFGYETIEYGKYHISSLYSDSVSISMGKREVPIEEVRDRYRKNIEAAIIKLNSVKEILEEKLRDLIGSANETIETYDFWTDIHPRIASVSRSRFESIHYADSVESAFKEINTCVKEIVRRKTSQELDGATLMRTAFSPKNAVIVLDDLSTESGKNIQQGYMEIFAGAMIGIRNPKAHDNIHIKEDRAKHFIYLASLLMNKIDERM